MPDKRLIDANIKVTLQTYDDMYEEHRTETLTIAEVLDGFADEGCPHTIDAVEVVRCRKCKHSIAGVVSDDEKRMVRCTVFHDWIDRDGYCHMGEKMDGGEEGV